MRLKRPAKTIFKLTRSDQKRRLVHLNDAKPKITPAVLSLTVRPSLPKQRPTDMIGWPTFLPSVHEFASGPSRQFTATQRLGRFRSEVDTGKLA